MEQAHSVNGVAGRLWRVKNPGVRAAHCHDAQKWISEARPVPAAWGYGDIAALRPLMRVGIRHDDSCKNGSNSFSITAEIFRPNARDSEAGGCLHDEIRELFPELAGLIKWHLSSTEGPMHYVANSLYWLGFSGFCGTRADDPPNLKHARSVAVWPDMPESMICPPELRGSAVGTTERKDRGELARDVEATLKLRLPDLLADFQRDIEAAGFEFTAAAAVEA